MALCSSPLQITNSIARASNTGETDQPLPDSTMMMMTSSSPSSTSSPNVVETRWSPEALGAIETHLSLLHQQNYLNNNSNVAAISNQQSRESSEGNFVDISCQGSLPDGWEQQLDLRTGQVYYIDWNTCKRTTVDPRKVLTEVNGRIEELIQKAIAARLAHQPEELSEQMMSSDFDDDFDLYDDDEEEHDDDAVGVDDSYVYDMMIDSDESMSSECCVTSVGSRGSRNQCSVANPCSEEMEVESKMRSKENDLMSSQWQYSMDEVKQSKCTEASLKFSSLISSQKQRFPLVTKQELELVDCIHCLLSSIIHRANPWCPHCGHFLV